MKINKGQFWISSRTKKLSFDIKRGHGNFFRFFTNRIRWHIYPRLQYVSKFPDHVDIEISSACNLNCPMCYTITDEFKTSVRKTIMDFDLYKKLVDECAQNSIYSIRLSLRGEPFLHPKIIEMIKYAKNAGIREVSVMSNGLRLDPPLFEKLVDVGLDWLIISFDGLGEMYESVRNPAKFEEAVEKIKIYREIKKQKRSVKPVVKIQSIWPAIKDNPKAFYDLFEPYVDGVASNPLIDYLRKDSEIEYINNFTCPVLWQRLVIGSNGHVLLCSNDEMEANLVGDVTKETIYDVWHGEKLQKARKLHMKKMGAKKLVACAHCYYPRKTVPKNELIGNRIIKVQNYVKRSQEIGK